MKNMNMKTKMKGIPIYLIALVLIVGAVAGAGIWFLTVNVPVEYYNPVNITLYSERDTGSQYGVGVDFSLRDTHTHSDDIDMTYSTFHQYVTFANPVGGKPALEIDVAITALDSAEVETDTIGFVIINEEEVDPQDVTWNYHAFDGNRVSAVYDGTTYTVSWGNDNRLSTGAISPDSSDHWTVIYIVREYDTSAPYDPISLDVENINWEFVDVTP